MKRTISILLALCLMAGLLATPVFAAGEDISAVFTDPNFLAGIYDALGKQPGEPIAAEECAEVKVLRLHDRGIKSLAGIEYFTGLKELDCSNNWLTTLDTTQNERLELLYCDDNELTALNLAKNTRLKYLDVGSNQLTALDVSLLKNLEFLSCGYNQLTTLDLTQNKGLIRVECENNQLAALDVSYSMILERLYCQNNQLTALDLRNNPRLTIVDCSKNNMSSAFKVKGAFSLQTAQVLSGSGQFKFYPQNDPGSIAKFPGYLFHAAPYYMFAFFLYPLRLILTSMAKA